MRAESHLVDGDDVDEFYGVPGHDVNNWTTRVRGQVSFDARTDTSFGLVRTYIALQSQVGHQNVEFEGPTPPGLLDSSYDSKTEVSSAFIEISRDWGTYTAGRRGSFFDFWGAHGYGTRLNIDDSTVDTTLFALTLAGGHGLSFTISAEDPKSAFRSRKRDGDDDYEGQEAPDGVANIRLDQGWGSAQIMGAVRHIHDKGDFLPPGPIPGPLVKSPDSDGIGFAVGAGIGIGVPMGWRLDAQGGYSEGAIAYITDDPGTLGDFSGPSGDDQNTAWSVRAGIVGPLFSPKLTAWLDGSFTAVDADDSDNYDAWAVKTGARWEPVPGLGMGPELAFQSLDMHNDGTPAIVDVRPSYDVWGVMWRIQRNF